MGLDVHELDSLAEARGVISVNAAAWRVAYDFLPASARPSTDYRPSPDRVAEFHRNAQARRGPVLVATREGRVRGFADLRWGPDDRVSFAGSGDAQLEALYVHPDDWGNGIGTRLLVACLFVVPPAYDRLVLQVFRENRAARGFYESQGFTRVGESTLEKGDEFPTVVYAREVS